LDSKESFLKDLPPSTEFDPRKAYHAVKSREGMLAFTGFELTTSPRDATEGILKISAYRAPYRGDTLILTFIIDADPGRLDKETLARHFDQVAANLPAKGMGAGYEGLNMTCLDCIGGIKRWFIQELRLAYRKPLEQKKTLLERDVLPQLGQILNCRFEPLEWWPQGRPAGDVESSPDWIDRPGWKPLRSLLDWWRDS
jgi:hypothetical protein